MSRIDQRPEHGHAGEEQGVHAPSEAEGADVPVPATESGMPPLPDSGHAENRAARLPQDVEDKFTIR